MHAKWQPFTLTTPVPPGRTLRESIEILQLSPEMLAQRTETTVSSVEAVLAGTTAITPEFAEALTGIIDVPADFWLRYDAKYHQALAAAQKRRE